MTDLSSTDQPGHGDFILVLPTPGDWRSPQNAILWQWVNGTNNPCPAGYRLPTMAEWLVERNSWGSSNYNSSGAFASPLKLPVAGARSLVSGGSLFGEGSIGYYWSSTVFETNSLLLSFNRSSAIPLNNRRAFGRSVRCLKD